MSRAVSGLKVIEVSSPLDNLKVASLKAADADEKWIANSSRGTGSRATLFVFRLFSK